MSGATDFDKFQDKSKKAKTQQELEMIQKEKEKKAKEAELKNKPDVKFQFVKEEDEWAAIARYNKYLYDKRQTQHRNNIKGQQKQLYSDLNEQRKIKERYKKQEDEENKLYHQ